jgi:GntR family transcriptional regulator of vanillate catabolism
MPTNSPLASVNPLHTETRSRLVDEVTHRLRELILSHRLPAGARLLQIELAERLGVSRTPLREAIRLLEHEGLVRISNGNRTVEVASLSGDELRELYEIREVVDGLAARLLARRGIPAEAEAPLTASLEQMASSVLPLQGEAFFVAHVLFHSTILEHCGNQRLQSHLGLVRMTAASLRDEFPLHVRVGPKVSREDVESTAQRTISEHRAILDAIRDGNEIEAETCARCHIRRALDEYIHPALATSASA